MAEADRDEGGSPWDHVGPGTPGGRLLRAAWQPIHRTCDLVAGAPPTRLPLLGEHFTLFRLAGGRPVLLQDRCPHRGTILALGSLERDALRCHHHGFRFDAAGRCVERPGEQRAAPDRCAARSYPVEEYLGLVFAWLGEGQPPPLPRHVPYEAPGVLRVLPCDVWPCGFFQRLENSCDVAHVASAHRTSGVGDVFAGELAISAAENDEGIAVTAEVSGRSLPPIRFVLPNLLEFATPVSEAAGWRDHLVWRVPIDDRRCVSFVVTLVPAAVPHAESYRMDAPAEQPFAPSETARIGDEVLAGRLRLSAVRSGSLTEIEDYIALVGQGAPHEHATEVLGRLDAPVIALRRRWRRAASATPLAGAR